MIRSSVRCAKMPGPDVVHIGARNLRRVSFDFVHSIGGCFGFRLLHQVDRASSYFRSLFSVPAEDCTSSGSSRQGKH